MNSSESTTETSHWWGALGKPSFSTREFRQEAAEHFGDQSYSTGQLFALCDDDQKAS
ncbi:MAG TPA: hypothetical protein VIT68_01505 [Candidatus Gracilibacteria bacterium]